MTLMEILAALDGAKIPGGCDHCDAWQEPHVDASGVGVIVIRHDDWCPVLATQRGRRR